MWWPKGEGKDFALAPHDGAADGVSRQDAGFRRPRSPQRHGRPRRRGRPRPRQRHLPDRCPRPQDRRRDIHAGVSIDQVTANHIGHLTRFPSLELTCDAVRKSGNCDSGLLLCVPVQPRLAIAHHAGLPRAQSAPAVRTSLRRRRAAASAPASLKRRQHQQTFDPRFRDGRRPQPRAASWDRATTSKLDEYLTSVRDDRERASNRPSGSAIRPIPNVETPAGIPAGFADYIQLMYDMMLLAFQTDSTRVATFLLGQRRQQPLLPRHRHPRRAPLPDAPPGQHGQDREGRADRPLVRRAVCQVPREAGPGQGHRRQLDAPQLDDRLRLRATPTATATRTSTCRSSWRAAAAARLRQAATSSTVESRCPTSTSPWRSAWA